ncbi:MAG: glycine/betaine/sarcosine/D-proline family reductase selenoprotein B [Candidatus Rokuibacteriota bacterium]|nr:MAG: glycine/betaine/sarcosine/D-proline family reductase selenoprotein B [Candidatus Rokubacteria bacterium]
MTNAVRVIHYINQFFGGIGAEDKADVGPSHRPGPVGPGTGLSKYLGADGQVVGTLICGDNFFVEHEAEAVETLSAMAESYRADVLVAGPAFTSGRYGAACGTLASAWMKRGKPAVTAMNASNPGVELFRGEVYIVPTGPTAASMGEALPRLAALALKLGRGAEIGSAEDDGYFSRGARRNIRLERSAAERALDMLLAKLAGRPYRTELFIESFGTVAPPPPVPDLSRALVALVTESGLVPHGNPDRLETWNASKWFAYPIAGLADLERGRYEAWHGGCDTSWTNDDPDRAVPLDAARRLERDGVIGRLHDHYYVTTGNMANIKTMTRIGAEIAQDLTRHGVQAVILTAT